MAALASALAKRAYRPAASERLRRQPKLDTSVGGRRITPADHNGMKVVNQYFEAKKKLKELTKVLDTRLWRCGGRHVEGDRPLSVGIEASGGFQKRKLRRALALRLLQCSRLLRSRPQFARLLVVERRLPLPESGRRQYADGVKRIQHQQILIAGDDRGALPGQCRRQDDIVVAVATGWGSRASGVTSVNVSANS